MRIFKTFSLAVAATSTTVFARLHVKFAKGGHGASPDGLRQCLDMYVKAAGAAHQEPRMFWDGDWEPLEGVNNYDFSINNSRFNCTGAEDSVFEDGKRRSTKSRTVYVKECMPHFRIAATEGAQWAHCSIRDHDFRHGMPLGQIYMGWSPKGYEICNDQAKKGKKSTGPCRITRDQDYLHD
ncbi:hypothetical protein CERZMDRAFT_100033 [Cercospora zeae-maydis SCOH1-5]|uniref:Uncharacterized protein n=1 Tax=Cercospora zeae-maydis SCOH1-5 TaxID=717836 RepID=A0A6A6F9B3_9PEZI|nr:hypothetical protein CERZMDRAFT_100033 [Cercospora zeae-maydis SCOH1-5]